jgi:hypothetical protein
MITYEITWNYLGNYLELHGIQQKYEIKPLSMVHIIHDIIHNDLR